MSTSTARATTAGTGLGKPLAPSRAKRASLTPTSRTNIGPNKGTLKVDDGFKPVGTSGGGLREKSDEEMKRVGRVEMEAELRCEWEMKDKLVERVERLENERDAAERARSELVQSLAGMQTRVDEAFNEQGRLEADLEGRDHLLERMRQRLGDNERAVRDAQKRYTEQEKSFEAERDAFRAQETQLLKRLRSQTSLKPASSPRSSHPPSPTANAATESLQEELASLSASHCTLVAQLNTIAVEVGDLRARNKELEEENSGWELLMRERTLTGGMKGRGLLSEEWLEDELSNASDVDENELEAPEIGGSFRRCNIGDAPPAKSKRVRARKSDLERLEEEIEADDENYTAGGTTGGLDLASEMGRVGGEISGIDDLKASKPVEVEALRSEIKSLKDANKALTLYCSKIIDRIIAQEGFEHVLSVDYKTHRLKTQRSTGKFKDRISVQEIIKTVQADAPPASSPQVTMSPMAEQTSVGMEEDTRPVRKGRPLSMMVRGWSSSVVEEKKAVSTAAESSVPAPAPAPGTSPLCEFPPTKEEEAKAAKRAKRGFSLDFRSFGFGTSSNAPAPVVPSEPKGLRPLTLQTRSISQSSQTSFSPSTTASPLLTSPAESYAKKLDVCPEDEEDRRERHRMEAAMRLMGINRPCHTTQDDEEMLSDEPTMLSGVSTSSTSVSARMETPLSRMASRLSGISSTALELADPLARVTDDAAVAALADFDKREKEQVMAMSKGTYKAEFTSPSSYQRNRRSVHRDSARDSLQFDGTPGSPQRPSSDGHEALRTLSQGRMPKSDSISTLWSAGSGSRPASIEVQRC